MNILIVSDTHGRADRLLEISRRADWDMLLFLGDGLRDLSLLPDELSVVAVRGNCDFFGAGTPDTRVIEIGACRVMMTHGHRFGVKSGPGAAIGSAVAADADVLLYGHTHVPFEKTLPVGTKVGERVLKKPLLVLCPGSLGDPRDGVPTFGTLTVRNSGFLLGLGKL